MATAYKGLYIEFDGDTSKLGRALSDLRKESAKVERELRAIDKALELDPGNVELLGQRARYTSEQANILQERIDLVNHALASGDVKRGTQEYDRLQRELVTTGAKLDDVRAAAVDSAQAFRRAAAGAGDAAEGMEGVGERADGARSGLDALDGRLDGLKGSLLDGAAYSVADKGLSLITDAASAAAEAIATLANDYDAAWARIDAACGAGTEAAESLKQVGRDLYTDGWGESMDSLADSLVSAREVLGDLSEADLAYVVEGALALGKTFGSDLAESLRGANVLMEKFGLSAQDATDLLVSGTQRGLDYTDELGDNLSEYAGRWGDAGTEASKYFSLLEAGVDNGAYSLDKVGDYLNEFLTSLTDGRMEESIGDFSKATQDVFRSFRTGAASAEDVLNAVVGELAAMPDEYKKAQLASELWSSLGEDNAMSMIESLANVEDSYGDVAGAAEEAADAISDTAAGKVETALRRLGDALSPIADAAAETFADLAADLADWAKGFVDASEHVGLVEDATRDLSDVVSDASENMGKLGDAAADAFGDVEDAAKLGEEALRGVADMKGDVADTFSSIATDSAKLDAYVGVIEELGNKGELTSYQQDRLREAVERYNDITGQSVEVTDAAAGEISASTEELRDNAQAWRESAEAQAYASKYTEALEQQIDAEYSLEKAQDALAGARERHSAAESAQADIWERMSGIADKSGQEYQDLMQRYLDYAEVIRETNDQIPELEQSVADCQTAYDELGEAVAYFDEKAVLASADGRAMTEALSSQDLSEFKAQLDAQGTSVDALAAALASAGVETSTLSEIGSANLATLAANCEGDVSRMVWAIQNYNAVPVVDKDGNVTINDAELMDAQGNVYAWNESGQLVDKDGNVQVNVSGLEDAQGYVWDWNGTELVPHSATATVDHESVDEATDANVEHNENPPEDQGAATSVDSSSTQTDIDRTETRRNNPPQDQSATTTITRYEVTRRSTVDAGGHAAGGIRRHARGGIANRRGAGVPLDVVGENGAEAIVPLTNRRYAMPFVEMIADEVAERTGDIGSFADALGAASGDIARSLRTGARRDGRGAATARAGDTYHVTIRGITYDDGSNIADAARQIVRAARISRRR